jgi:hypothetical protein
MAARAVQKEMESSEKDGKQIEKGAEAAKEDKNPPSSPSSSDGKEPSSERSGNQQ